MKRQTCPLVSLFLIFTVFISTFCFPATLLAAPYYEGKRISIIVGYGPGGGYDRTARLLAKHLPKYIPGKPVVIVENMEGAVSMIAANHIYNIAKPDGLTLGTVNRGLPFAQLLKAQGVKFDLSKFSWIGSTAVESNVLTIRSDLPYRSFDDLLKRKGATFLSSGGPGASSNQFPVLLKEFAGLNIDLVIYVSSSEEMLAVERKEVDGRAGSYSSFKPFIDRGLVRAIVRGRVSEPGIENLPVDEDLTKSKMGKTMMVMRSSGDLIGRPFIAPPGVPADVMNILRDAFSKATKDPQFLGESTKMGMTIDYTPGNECVKALSYVFNQPEDIVKEFGKHIKF